MNIVSICAFIFFKGQGGGASRDRSGLVWAAERRPCILMNSPTHLIKNGTRSQLHLWAHVKDIRSGGGEDKDEKRWRWQQVSLGWLLELMGFSIKVELYSSGFLKSSLSICFEASHSGQIIGHTYDHQKNNAVASTHQVDQVGVWTTFCDEPSQAPTRSTLLSPIKQLPSSKRRVSAQIVTNKKQVLWVFQAAANGPCRNKTAGKLIS